MLLGKAGYMDYEASPCAGCALGNGGLLVVQVWCTGGQGAGEKRGPSPTHTLAS